MPKRNNSLRTLLGWGVLLCGVVAVAALVFGPNRGGIPPLVVYCAHDAEFADAVLRDFEQQTGIPVSIRYDTEATKSLGLVNLLKTEKDHPRCDVFWNNELLGTVDLQQSGVLEPYRGSGHARIPDHYKDPEGYWTGFAARLRVFIANREKARLDPGEFDKKLDGADDLSRVAIAKPLFGTTLTHYTVLWNSRGAERLKAWHASLQSRRIREVQGNAATKNLVAEGACDVGFTDTDDFFVALDAGKPVSMLPVRVEGKTICIPNTVAIIRGTRQKDAAQKLVDFLLSAETELRLARSAARQVPLGPIDGESLPEEVRPLAEWARDGFDLRPLLSDRKAVIDWLKSEYLQ